MLHFSGVGTAPQSARGIIILSPSSKLFYLKDKLKGSKGIGRAHRLFLNNIIKGCQDRLKTTVVSNNDPQCPIFCGDKSRYHIGGGKILTIFNESKPDFNRHSDIVS